MTARNTNTASSTATVRAARVPKAAAAAAAAAHAETSRADKLRAARAEHAAKKRAAPAPEAQVKPTVVEELGAQEEVAHTAFQEFSAMFENFKLPSGKRMLCSVVVQFITIASGVYSGFQVAGMLSLAAVMFTGSAFLAFVGYFLAAALGIYASLIASARIGRYIALGEIDHDIARARSWMSAKFTAVKAKLPMRGAKGEGDQHA